MAFISFLGIFYIFVTCLLLLLLFTEKDDWYKMFHFLGVITILALMIHLTVFQNSVDNNYPTEFERIVLDDLDLNSLTETSQEVLDNDRDYHVVSFTNLNTKNLGLYEKTNFCFNYNESGDGDNVLRVSSTTKTISDYIYIRNGTSGVVCSEINSTLIKEGVNLGVFCEDCSGGNTVLLPKYSGSEVKEIHINKSNPLNYVVKFAKPHNYYLENYMKPVQIVNKNFNWFLFFLSIHIMMYTSRFLLKYAKEGTNY